MLFIALLILLITVSCFIYKLWIYLSNTISKDENLSIRVNGAIIFLIISIDTIVIMYLINNML